MIQFLTIIFFLHFLQFELREYPARNWVCTFSDSTQGSETAMAEMYWRLYWYIRGSNILGKK